MITPDGQHLIAAIQFKSFIRVPERCAFFPVGLNKNGLGKHRGVFVRRHNGEPRFENAVFTLNIAPAQIPHAGFGPISDPLCRVFLDDCGVVRLNELPDGKPVRHCSGVLLGRHVVIGFEGGGGYCEAKEDQ